MRRSCSRSLASASVLIAALLSGTTGCGNQLGILSYWLNGITPMEAKFKGLEGKRVAVVCLDGNSLSGPSSDADSIAKAVTTTLGYKVPDIQIVRQPEIADWIDSQNQDL